MGMTSDAMNFERALVRRAKAALPNETQIGIMCQVGPASAISSSALR